MSTFSATVLFSYILPNKSAYCNADHATDSITLIIPDITTLFQTNRSADKRSQ
jgi:hypothetical protein